MAGVLERMKCWLFAEEEEEEPGAAPGPRAEPRKNRRGPLLSLRPPRDDEIYIRKPRAQDDAPACADCLVAGRPVVVNLKYLEDTEARRVFDFLKGAVYALDGHMEEAGDGIFLLTPRGTEISAEVESPSGRDRSFWEQI